MTKDVQDRQPGEPDGPTPPVPHSALRRTVRVWGVRVLLGLALLVAILLWATGAHMRIFLLCAVAGLGVLLAVLGLVGLLRWRTGWRWRSAGLAGWAGVLIILVLYYVFAWLPWQRFRAGEFRNGDASPAEVRAICHRLLFWGPAPHDPLIRLRWAGDETSVPYILWAMVGLDGQVCTYDHAVKALETITNQSPGRTLDAWREWYEKNRRRPQMTWWADGFVAEGYKAFPYEGTDGPKAARELLAALGRSTWLESPSKWYLTFNAARMLKRLPLADVRKAMGEALKGESPAEKRGLARYTEDLSRAEGEPMLKALAADGDRSVRLAATGQICGNLVEHWPVGDNDPVWRPCTRGQVPPEVLAAATGPSTTAPVVVFPRAGRSSEVRRPAEVSKAIRETPTPLPGTVATGTHGNIGWRIRVEGLKPQPPDPNAVRDEPYVLHVEGSSLQAGRKVYSRQLANSRAGQADSVCWLLDAPSGRLYVSIHTYTAAIEVETGEVIWEVGVGATSSDDLNLLGPFLVVSPWCRGLIIFGAEGDIVASRGRRDVRLDPARLRLFDGRVWAQDSDGRWCVLDFSDTHAPWSEPAEQEPSAPTPGTGH